MTHDPDFEDRNSPKFDTDEEAKDWHRKNLAEKIEKSETKELEDWQNTLKQKYDNLKNICDENFTGLWYSLELELSVQKILNINGCTLPFAAILLGPPSSLKTVGIELFRKYKNTFYTDNFSARAFVSHSTTVPKKELDKIDTLPRMKNNFFLTPELSPIFGKKYQLNDAKRRIKLRFQEKSFLMGVDKINE